VSKPPSLPVQTRLSVKAKCPSVWLNACGPLPRALVLDNASIYGDRFLKVPNKAREEYAQLAACRNPTLSFSTEQGKEQLPIHRLLPIGNIQKEKNK
jgi:hypothetical protein